MLQRLHPHLMSAWGVGVQGAWRDGNGTADRVSGAWRKMTGLPHFLEASSSLDTGLSVSMAPGPPAGSGGWPFAPQKLSELVGSGLRDN